MKSTKKLVGSMVALGVLCSVGAALAGEGRKGTNDQTLTETQAGQGSQRSDTTMQRGTDVKVMKSDTLQWQDEASLPPGAKASLLFGDPTKAAPFAVRLKLPANFRIPAHTHPVDSNVTVIQGEFRVGAGDKLDPAAATALMQGDFEQTIRGTKHFGMTGDQETIIQLNATGPWGITYVNAQDDPRKRAQREGAGTTR